ncbi:endonuclease VII domain-containing protein [Amycolatopsis sp.]|uniref:endonuclease VII domain-containing protein n=1 Tax=Amycolatopsis sp. TaxID=37632 RepID=UPI002CBAA77C|nr:endonuclease VII domain-containing protein [Amycolatopsis sp.]HVV11610.1 endonuclease VII domain-containing protein [Amycolatopsis sp.]
MTRPAGPVCIDCIADGVTNYRPVVNRSGKPYGGPRSPRCYTHSKARRRSSKDRQHAAYVMKTYGITGEQYWALYDHQGGRCAICQRATGRAKRLAVDHDHACCPELPGCGRCVRGLCCKSCNRDVLGHLRDDIEAFLRGAAYLRHPPAWDVIYPDGGHFVHPDRIAA